MAHRQLAECDENLCGTKLSPSERALFTKTRKRLYLALHPETAATRDGGEGRRSQTRRQLGDDTAKRFTADTAANTGKSERVIQRDAERGEKIDERALESIKGTALDNGASSCRRHRGRGAVLQAPATALQVLQDRLGHDLLGELVAGQALPAEVAQDAGRTLPQRHAEIEQDTVAVRHAGKIA